MRSASSAPSVVGLMSAISVIIPTYQRRESLRLCLEALRCQTLQDFDVFVVDDGGDDQSQEVFMQSGVIGVYLWSPHNGFGLSRCRNLGARCATGEVLHFIDSDIMLCPAALEVAWELYQEKKDRAIGGYYKYLPGMVITLEDVREWETLWSMDLPKIEIEQRDTPVGMDVRDAWRGMRHHLNEQPVDVFAYEHEVLWSPFVLLGGNMVIPREIFEKTGGFDENITTYGGEDADMSLAIISRGYGISYSRRLAGGHIAHPKQSEASIAMEIEKRKYIASKYPRFLNPDGTPKPDVWGKEVPR